MRGKTRIGRVTAMTAIITAAALVIAAGIGFATGVFEPGRHADGGWTIDERKQVSLEGVETVTISATSENVRIVSGTGTAAEAWLHGKISAGNSDASPRLVVERSGKNAVIRVEHPSVQVGIVWSTIELEVSVPGSYARGMSVETSSGNIDLAERTGTTLDLKATSGDLHAVSVRATTLTARTSSGRVRIESARATGVEVSATSGDLGLGTIEATDFSAHTGSGGITVDALKADHGEIRATSGHIRAHAAGGELRAETSSGEITLAFSGQPARVDATATSGDVTVQLPSAAQFTLDARANSGEIRCDFPITITANAPGGRHDLAGTVGSPAGTVSIRTSSGSIRVEKQ